MGTKISDLPVTVVLPADAVFPLEYSGANYSVKASDLGTGGSGPRAYVAFDGTAGDLTASITKSFNVDSITDNAVGDYTVNLTNAVTDPVPVASLLYPAIAVNPMDVSFTVVSGTAIRILTGTNSSGLFDANGVYLVVF